MENEAKQVRRPQQKRSLEKLELIKHTALQLFSEKGYFSTTTNEIAKQAGISIGTLYSYYRDKKDIYEELVREHYENAAQQADEAQLPEGLSPRQTVYLMLAATMQAHFVNTAFQKEMAALSAQSEEMRAIEQKYRGNMSIALASMLEGYRDFYRVTDFNTAALLIQTSLKAVIHETVFYPNNYDKEAVLKELTDMFCSYLLKPEYQGSAEEQTSIGKTEFYVTDHLLMFAAYPTPEEHSHLALHLIVAPEGSVISRVGGSEAEGTAMLIASDVPHTSENPEGPLLIFLFDETGADAESLKQRFLRDRDYCILDEALAQRLRDAYNGNLAEYDAEVMVIMGLNDIRSRMIDPRVSDVLKALRSAETIDGTTIKMLCDRVHLSQSRLSHLFKEQTGIALNRYLVLARMRLFSDYFRVSGNITDACMRAGFDTPSHFASTCKRMFGISVSGVKRSME